MCVERTANTNEPSARRSRCNVACQNLAAAVLVMALLCLDVCCLFMMARLQVRAKGIYPVSDAEFNRMLREKFGTSGFARGRHRFVSKSWSDAPRRNDHYDRRENNRAGQDGSKGERLAT